MSEKIRVTFIKVQENRSSPVFATVGFHLPKMDMYLSKCKLIQKKDGSFYVAPPSEKYTDPQTGRETYGNFFWFGERTSEFFQKQALEAIKEYCQYKGIDDPTIVEFKSNKNHSGAFESSLSDQTSGSMTQEQIVELRSKCAPSDANHIANVKPVLTASLNQQMTERFVQSQSIAPSMTQMLPPEQDDYIPF